MENWILILIIIVLTITLSVAGILVYKKGKQGKMSYNLTPLDTFTTKDGWLLSCKMGSSPSQIDQKNKVANLGCQQSYTTPTFTSYCAC